MKASNAGLVTVIIPAYNAEEYLEQALNSLLEQNYSNLEVIVVDDGSTDSTRELARKFADANPQLGIQVVSQENAGQGSARNRASALATGEFIFFLDADDRLAPQSLLKLVQQMQENPSADFIHFHYQYFYEGSTATKLGKPEVFFGKNELRATHCDEYLRMHHYFAVPKLYRRNFLLENAITFGEGYAYEDYEFVVLIANKAEHILISEEPLYQVRMGSSSTTKSGYQTKRHFDGFLAAANKSLTVLEPRTPESEYYLARYLLGKYFSYYPARIPKELRKEFSRRSLDIFTEHSVVIPNHPQVDALGKLIRNSKVISKKRYRLFRVFSWFSYGYIIAWRLSVQLRKAFKK